MFVLFWFVVFVFLKTKRWVLWNKADRETDWLRLEPSTLLWRQMFHRRGGRGWGEVSQCKSPLSSSRKPRDPLAINNTVLITIQWLTQCHLHAEHFVWDTWPAPEATIPHCSVSPETTHRHLRTVHIETATGRPSSWSTVFLWRGRVFPTRMMFLVKKSSRLKKKVN